MGFHGIWQPKQERNNVNMFIQNTFNYESIVFDHSSSQMLETVLWNYSKILLSDIQFFTIFVRII